MDQWDAMDERIKQELELELTSIPLLFLVGDEYHDTYTPRCTFVGTREELEDYLIFEQRFMRGYIWHRELPGPVNLEEVCNGNNYC